MRLLSALTFALAALAALPAHACWDGHLIAAERIVLRGDRDTWDIDHVRAYGRWIPRIQALLGETHFITDQGINLLCTGEEGSDDCVELTKAAPEELFEEIADRLKLPAAKVKAARRLKTGAWTIQLAAGGLLALKKRAEAIDLQLEFKPLGIAEYGGFPAANPVAFVVPRADDHALIVGVWLDAASARAALAELRKRHGLEGFVRRL